MQRFLGFIVVCSLAMVGEAQAKLCPAKLSERICPAFLDGQDSALLKVRIMLDPTLWMPSKAEENNPLVARAKEMVEQYEFKRIERPDSSYRPAFMSGGSPSIIEVLYHNVLATKKVLDSIIRESYVKEIQLGCRNTISSSLCDTFNFSLDSTWVKVFLYFQMEMEEDTSAIKVYLANYDTRNPENTSERFSPELIVKYPLRGFAISRADFEKMSADPEVWRLEPWSKITTKVRAVPRLHGKLGSRRGRAFSVDGRSVDMGKR